MSENIFLFITLNTRYRENSFQIIHALAHSVFTEHLRRGKNPALIMTDIYNSHGMLLLPFMQNFKWSVQGTDFKAGC